MGSRTDWGHHIGYRGDVAEVGCGAGGTGRDKRSGVGGMVAIAAASILLMQANTKTQTQPFLRR